MSDTKEIKKITTPEFRASFPSVVKPTSFSEAQEKKYEVTALFPVGTDLAPLMALAKQAAVDKWGDKIPTGLRSPFRDGSEKPDLDGYEPGVTFIKMTTKQRPGLVDAQVQPIIEEGEFYGGCYARATVTAFAYDQAGNRGVSFGLQNLQKTRDGDPFSGRAKAEDDFEAITDVTGGGDASAVTPAATDIFD